MLEYCPKSCGVCQDEDCIDEGEYCSDWAQNGECQYNPEYMLEFCKKSCGVC